MSAAERLFAVFFQRHLGYVFRATAHPPLCFFRACSAAPDSACHALFQCWHIKAIDGNAKTSKPQSLAALASHWVYCVSSRFRVGRFRARICTHAASWTSELFPSCNRNIGHGSVHLLNGPQNVRGEFSRPLGWNHSPARIFKETSVDYAHCLGLRFGAGTKADMMLPWCRSVTSLSTD